MEAYKVRSAVMFGSYAEGAQDEKSDVDLIDVQEIIPDGEADREIRRTGIEIYG